MIWKALDGLEREGGAHIQREGGENSLPRNIERESHEDNEDFGPKPLIYSLVRVYLNALRLSRVYLTLIHNSCLTDITYKYLLSYLTFFIIITFHES
jgi:hypothetical protein